jgi:predicted Zn finger-like uncharacterized protein
MILTCPQCATSYFASDAAIGSGRTVRCGACGVSWRARSEVELELIDTPEEGAIAVAAAVADESRTIPGAMSGAPGEDILDRPISEFSELPGEELPKAFRARAQAERKVREAAAQGAVWAGLGAAFALLLGLAVVFRMDVVQMWPKTASAYASVGLRVNVVGLDIENVHTQPSLQDGRPALLVSGVLRNIRAKTVVAPPLVVTLVDHQHDKLMMKTASPGDPSVPPGQSRTFAVTLVDPPNSTAEVDVGFLLSARAGARPPAQTRTASAAPVAPPPSSYLRAGPTSLADLSPPASASPVAQIASPGPTAAP